MQQRQVVINNCLIIYFNYDTDTLECYVNDDQGIAIAAKIACGLETYTIH